jgi:hypothetical protein
MPLTEILRMKEARQALRPLIRNPGTGPLPSLRVEPRRNAPTRIGTAFHIALDYGLRSNCGCDYGGRSLEDDLGWILLAKRGFDEEAAIVRRVLEEQRPVAAGIKGRALSDVEAAACLDLERLHLICRTGSRFLPQLGLRPTASEIAELRELFAVVPWSEFRGTFRLVSGASFPVGSDWLCGADCDLIRDHELIEVKTLKNYRLERSTLHQVVGYALLANRFGTNRDDVIVNLVQYIAVYFSRHGAFRRFTLNECVDEDDHDVVLDWILRQGEKKRVSRGLAARPEGA